MFGILVSAANAILGWVIRTVIIKFLVFTALYLITTEFMSVVAGMLPSGDGGLSSAMAQMTPGAWYFIELLRLDVGLPLMLSAAVTGFVIRRLPVIG